MNSTTLPSFWSAYARLDETTRRSARKAYRLWAENPYHPSLHFECINREENIWSVRVTRGYREDQRGLLQRWGIPVHQIGVDVGRKGMEDEEIIPYLHTLRDTTFFTRDLGFRVSHTGFAVWRRNATKETYINW